MTPENNHTGQKQIYIRAYEQLSLLKNDLNLIKKDGPSASQASVLGKVNQFYLDNNIEIQRDGDSIKWYWEKILGNRMGFGCFYNSEIGNVFIVGAFSSTFLQKINDKVLGTLSAGLYGIIRGIGADELQATDYLKQLNNGSYLLILRDFGEEIEKYKIILEKRDIV